MQGIAVQSVSGGTNLVCRVLLSRVSAVGLTWYAGYGVLFRLDSAIVLI
jgi:hypothetical protein